MANVHLAAARVAGILALVAGGGCATGDHDAAVAQDAARARADAGHRAHADVPSPGAGAEAGTDSVTASLLALPLTEDAAVKLALLGNPAVRASYERLGIARADLLQAGLVSNPVFRGNVKSFAAGPEIEIGIAQSFLDLFLAPIRARVAEAEREATEAAVTRDLVRLVYDVRRAVAGVRSAQGRVEMRRQVLEAATAARDLMRTLHDAGNAVDARLTVEEAEAARTQVDLADAEAAAREAREPLNVLLGLRGASVAWTVAGGLDEDVGRGLDLEAVEARALAASLDLAQARAEVAAALHTADLARRQGGLPSLDVGAVGKRESAGGAWGAGPDVAVGLPLFDQGQARCFAAAAAVRQRIARRAAVAVEVESAARRLRGRFAALRDRAKVLHDIYLPLRARLVKETMQSYNAMQIGAFDVLHAKQREVDARREHADTVRDAWIARLDLEELLAGTLDPPRLEAPATPREAEAPSIGGGH